MEIREMKMSKEKKSTPWIWGFTSSAENWNGRLAMIGFVLALVVEGLTGKGIAHFLGII
jgi:hypothetical protein